jgi:4-amino-4-deoxy-L-arabinose transferase-like glycosyltransferase
VPPLTTDRKASKPIEAGEARVPPARDFANVFALLLVALFVLQGLALIPYVGIQTDEALFSTGIFEPRFTEYSARVLGHSVPLMVMSYIGALKMWVYAAVFKVWPPSPFSIRVPVLLAGALTIWLFYRLLRATCGARAALAGCALLALDTTFLLTTTLDWGPVAFQHLLLLAGMLMLVRFDRSERLAELGAGFFLFGLGMWDKALFVWMLLGLGAATLITFPNTLLSRLTRRNLAVAAACFLLGAGPLVLYNIRHNFKTFTTNTHYTAADVDKKFNLVRVALEGGSLFGYIVRDEPAPVAERHESTLERWSVALSAQTDEPRSGLMVAALVLSLALLPWLWTSPARKPMLFSLIFLIVTWVQMAFNQNTGGGTHHTVLLWPFPHLLVAAALAQATRVLRGAGAAVLAVLIGTICVSNLLVTNQHYAQLIERGPSVVWTNAIYPLATYFKEHPAERVYVMDWGIFDSLRLLDEGSLPLWVGSDPVSKPQLDDNDRQKALEMIATPGAVFVGHTEGNEQLTGVSARLQSVAAAAGYRKSVLAVINDYHGRPIFEVYRWVRRSR